MGLFSSKKKITVNVTVQNVFEESQIPDSALNGVIRGILQGEELVENLLESVSHSIGVNAATGYHWLKNQDYNIGFPASQVKTYISAQTETLAAIAANIGQNITSEYYYMGPLNSMHFGWQYCHDALGYNPQTNELELISAQTGFKCYLSDMVATYLREDFDWMVETNDMGMLAQLGPSPRSGFRPSAPLNTLSTYGQYAEQPQYEVSDVATEDYVTINYEFEDANGGFITRGIVVSMAMYDNTQDFHMCRYKTAAGKTGFFTYRNGAGTYPLIDRAMAFTSTALGTFLPWTYFRLENQNIEDVESAETVKQMRKWCDYLGVNFDTLLEGVHKDQDVSDVAQTILMFAANPGDKNEACIEYLYKHFDVLHSNSLSQKDLVDGLDQKMQAFTSSPSQVQRIADNRFAMTFQYSGIQKQRVPGKIGKRGTYTSEFMLVSQDSQKYMTQSETGVGVEVAGPKQPAWCYRYQTLDSSFDEIVVFGMRADYEVHAKKGYAADKDAPELLIPVDYAILRTMGIPAQEAALCRFLRFQVNTVIITKTPWYASSVFKAILLVVAVVITVLSAGAAWQSLVAAASISATAVAITVLTYIVSSFVISYGVKLFVQKFGAKAGFLAAVVALAGSMYGFNADAGWASSMMQAATGLADNSSQYIAGQLEDVLADISDFQAWAAGQWESLEDQKAALGLNPMLAGLDTFDVVKLSPSIVVGETPKVYFNRTLQSGDITQATFDYVNFYADSMLQLPDLQQVNGNFYDGNIPTD